MPASSWLAFRHFLRSLRCADNTALAAAAEQHIGECGCTPEVNCGVSGPANSQFHIWRTQAMQGLSGQQQALDASRTALTGAVAEQRELEQGQRGAAQAVESYAQRASQLQAQLLAAKQKVDLAQVCRR